MFDLNINQGSDFSLPLKIMDSARVGINLTGYTFTGQVRLKYTDTLPVLTFTFVIANQTTNKGELEMNLARALTSALVLTEETTYLYDVEMKDTSDKVVKILYGDVLVTPEVSR